ncbi:MAG TPA: peptidylprolyl isomerase [Phenylobacterium sp.]|nr:peptidylprolyl isomerase [Phenylobacterium sp.]
MSEPQAIKRRTFLAAAAAAAASPALAQAPVSPVRVKLETAQGAIVLELYPDKAPITAGNFLRYVDGKRFDGATFYRASKVPNAPEFGLIQGGVQNDPAKVLKPIAHEPTTKTGLSHTDGVISMGRTNPGTATSDFFIVLGDMTYMDADPRQPGDNLGFAAFGKVVEGMDVARKILAEPTSQTAGVGVMKGEMLAKPVKIISARRAN